MYKHILFWIALLLSLITFFYSHALFADQKLQKVADDFQHLFSQYLDKEKIPGAAFAIVSKDGFIKIGTYGHTDLSKKKAVDENTVFRIASISKTFASSLTGIMVEEGQLSWDDYVTDYTHVLGRQGNKSKIKIKDLLGQTSGFQPYAYDLQIEDGLSFRTILRNLSLLPLRCQPGKCYAYQNSAFSAIDPVLKAVSKKSYEELLQEKIFDPLDMKDASLSLDSFRFNPNTAKPHQWKKGKPYRITNKPNYYRVKPAAGVNASVRDMVQYLQAHLGMHPKVLSATTLETLTEPRIRTKKDLGRISWRNYLSDAHYGLGWRNYTFLGQELIYHGGWIDGYRSDIAYSKKDGVGIIVMLNIDGRHTSYLTTQFFARFFKAKK